MLSLCETLVVENPEVAEGHYHDDVVLEVCWATYSSEEPNYPTYLDICLVLGLRRLFISGFLHFQRIRLIQQTHVVD